MRGETKEMERERGALVGAAFAGALVGLLVERRETESGDWRERKGEEDGWSEKGEREEVRREREKKSGGWRLERVGEGE